MNQADNQTFVASLTPAGSGGVATLALHGPGAWAIVRTLFRPLSPGLPALPEEPQSSRVWLGRLGEDVADQVVIAAKSVRDVPWIEVHSHGGMAVTRALLDSLRHHGAVVCCWQELMRREAATDIRAAAMAALAEARTVRTASILLDQLTGAFENAVDAIRAAWWAGDREKSKTLLGELASRARVGRHLTSPWHVVVAGAPNVGKSSLVNAVAGFQRSLVSSMPGTTRDLVTAHVALDGWPVELMDTAGVRDNASGLEAQGIDLARAALTTADLCLWVLDASARPVWPAHYDERLKYVVNKVDLALAWDVDGLTDAACVSALTGLGLTAFCHGLARWLVPTPPPPGAAVPFTVELCDRVEAAWNHWHAGGEEKAMDALG